MSDTARLTTDELLTIYSKAMASKSDAKYSTDRIKAGLEAVREAVIQNHEQLRDAESVPFGPRQRRDPGKRYTNG